MESINQNVLRIIARDLMDVMGFFLGQGGPGCADSEMSDPEMLGTVKNYSISKKNEQRNVQKVQFSLNRN